MAQEWKQARDRLASAVSSMGFPAELADLLARQLKYPKAIDRMTGYIHQARPRSLEMIVDEMYAIISEVEKWIDKKKSEEAWAANNAWMNREKDEDD